MVEITTARYRKGELEGYTDPLLWAIDTFRRNSHQFKPGAEYAARVAYVVKTFRLGIVSDHYDEGVSLDEWATKRVNRARQGNTAAWQLSFELAATLLQQGRKLPDVLRDFIVEHLRNPDKRVPQRPGRKRKHLWYRDHVISFAVTTISHHWELPATRNEATKGKHDSAASIVQKALQKSVGLYLTERAINKIWMKEVAEHPGLKVLTKQNKTVRKNSNV